MTFTTTIALLSLLPTAEPAPIILRNATVHDGSGKPGRVEEVVVVRGDRITAIGDGKPGMKGTVIDCTGLILAPGFIDLHSHSDDGLQKPATRANLNFLFQGVTTVVTGNCGSGPTDVAKYFATLKEGGIGTNVIHQMPHNAIRRQAMGNANRQPTAAELKKMEEIVEKGMKDGAWGMSTGLIYNPGTYSKTDEIIALTKIVGKHQGFYASHIRNEGVNVLVATDEAITIGKQAGVPVHISHMKASGEQAWGKAAEQVAMVRKAREQGLAVTADQYPYIASATSLSATVIPARFREGTDAQYKARLNDEEQLKLIRKALESELRGRRPKAIFIAGYSDKREWQGKNLETIAQQEKISVVDLVLTIERSGGASVVNFGMNEEDVRIIMKQDFVATASDGSAMVPATTVPHPRNYGCFPRKIGRYALEDGVVTLEHAIRSASGLPADILHLKDRGYVRKGYFADLVVIDPKTFRDAATFEKPHQYATGVRYLLVNGQAVIADGKYTGTLAGKVLSHNTEFNAPKP